MAGHLFISHVTGPDSDLARRLVNYLERHGQPCWIAPRDIAAGRNYAGVIADSIEACSGILLILSRAVGSSDAVARELELAVGRHKKPLFVFRIEDIDAPKNVAYFVSLSQRIDAVNQSTEDGADELLGALAHSVPKRSLLRRLASPLRSIGKGARRWLVAVVSISATAAWLALTAWINSDELSMAWRALTTEVLQPAASQPPAQEADEPESITTPSEDDAPTQLAVVAVGVRKAGDLARAERDARVLRVTGADPEGAEGLLADSPISWRASGDGVIDLEIQFGGATPAIISRVEMVIEPDWRGSVIAAIAPVVREDRASYGLSTRCDRTGAGANVVCIFAPQRARALRVRFVPLSKKQVLVVASISAYTHPPN